MNTHKQQTFQAFTHAFSNLLKVENTMYILSEIIISQIKLNHNINILLIHNLIHIQKYTCDDVDKNISTLLEKYWISLLSLLMNVNLTISKAYTLYNNS